MKKNNLGNLALDSVEFIRKKIFSRKKKKNLDYRNRDFDSRSRLAAASVSGESWRSPALDLPSAEFQPERIG